MPLDIVRYWKDPQYRQDCSQQNLTLPAHPAGLPLSEETLALIFASANSPQTSHTMHLSYNADITYLTVNISPDGKE